MVFRSVRVAVFIDGCFWHGCPLHFKRPGTHGSWWERKVQRNRARDIETDRELERRNWQVIRVWEHEDIDTAARKVEAAVCARRGPVG